MATFGQIVYSVLDLLKEVSDDAFYTEEHVIFLAGKMRSLLIERKYRGARNQAFKDMPSENKQKICLNLIPAEEMDGTCTGSWLRSIENIPSLVSGTSMSVYPLSDLIFSNIIFIPQERMPYVGYNRWLKNILYCSRSSDGHMYVHGTNPRFMLMDKVEAEGVFSDPAKAAELSCSDAGSESCDIMDREFPLEDSLVPSCIEMVVQELSGARYAPADNRNNAHDDLGDAALAQTKPSMPAERSAYAYRNQQPKNAESDEAGS